MAAAAKEARVNRRKDDRELEEYVRTLEVHLDQVSNLTVLFNETKFYIEFSIKPNRVLKGLNYVQYEERSLCALYACFVHPESFRTISFGIKSFQTISFGKISFRTISFGIKSFQIIPVLFYSIPSRALPLWASPPEAEPCYDRRHTPPCTWWLGGLAAHTETRPGCARDRGTPKTPAGASSRRSSSSW